RTPRALEHAPQTWIGMPSATVVRRISASGGQPTGTTALATGSRISDTASPRMKIWASWPPSASAFACRNAKAALVGSSEPQALLTSTFMLPSASQRVSVSPVPDPYQRLRHRGAARDGLDDRERYAAAEGGSVRRESGTP